ncbi:MAG: lysyl oxidase family protein, partial [Candidatus Limnocylindrales bacterium]
AIALLLVSAPAHAGGATDLLPDMRMLRLTDFHVEPAADQRLLRFSTVIVNVGIGPLDVVGQRRCQFQDPCPKMFARQRIMDSDGGWRKLPAAGRMLYAGDGHNHWHVQRMETYELFSLADPENIALARGAKVGYCFFDNVAHRVDLPGAPQSPAYGGFGCGMQSSQKTHVGLSVGWGDIYPWDFAYQWIDITDLPDGDYRVCVTADPEDRFVESNDGNNAVWQDLTLTAGEIELGAHHRSRCVG